MAGGIFLWAMKSNPLRQLGADAKTKIGGITDGAGRKAMGSADVHLARHVRGPRMVGGKAVDDGDS